MCLNRLKGYSGSIVGFLPAYSGLALGSGLFGQVVLVLLGLAFFFLREGLALYAITGGDGKMWLSSVFLISAQCFLKILLILFMSSEYCVAKISLLGCLVLTFLIRASFLSLKRMSNVADNLVMFVSSLSLCI